jgi:hypothetical protein
LVAFSNRSTGQFFLRDPKQQPLQQQPVFPKETAHRSTMAAVGLNAFFFCLLQLRLL